MNFKGELMLERLAQKIVDATKDVVQTDLIITNDQSIIIGASNKKRIGTFHEASRFVLEDGQPLENEPHYIEGMKGTLPGLTLPIEINNEIWGTIGITGQREEVEMYGSLAKKYAEILVKEEIYFTSTLLSNNAIEQFIKDLLLFNGSNSDAALLHLKGKEIGMDLKQAYTNIIFDFIPVGSNQNELDFSFFENKQTSYKLKYSLLGEVKKLFNNEDGICGFITNSRMIIFHPYSNEKEKSSLKSHVILKCEKLFKKVEKLGVEGNAVINLSVMTIPDIKSTYQSAKSLLKVNQSNRVKNAIECLEDHVLDVLICDLNVDKVKWYQEKFYSCFSGIEEEEMRNTLIVWVESGFSISKASKQLHIHRNTMNYRLEKMTQQYEIDPFNPKEAMAGYMIFKRIM